MRSRTEKAPYGWPPPDDGTAWREDGTRDDEGKSVYAPEECPECEGRLYVERTPYVDPAHPAATAREEAWKAMVDALEMAIVERTFLSNGCGDRIDRALALARATGGA